MNFTATESFKESESAQLTVVVKTGENISLVCEQGAAWQPIPSGLLPKSLPIVSRTPLGYLDNQVCEAVYVAEDFDEKLWAGYHCLSLRDIFSSAHEVLFQLAGRAVQLHYWISQHQYCGRCAAKTTLSMSDRSLVCTRCELRFYPRISPCTMVLISRGEECLLARGIHHPEGRYSAIAGFIEAGESAEQAAIREVSEEVGLRIDNLRYFDSQPWPFPGQLMVAYTADYLAGDIHIDPKEIIDAQWFRYDSLPSTPPQSSIAGRLIASFVASFNRN